MAQPSHSSNPNCYIEFRVYDTERFQVLMRFFASLRTYTRNEGAYAESATDDVTVSAVGSGNPEDTQESYTVARSETQTRRSFGKPEEWLLALRPADLDFLGLPDHRNAVMAVRSWQGLSRRERRKSIKQHDDTERLRQLADFIDMLRYWQDVQYELVSCEMTDSDLARITYSTFTYPFDGKIALEELLMFFGFLSIIHDSC